MDSNTLEILLLVAALSLDSFTAGLAYGANHIKIPLLHSIWISLICTLFLGISFLLGDLTGSVISSSVTSGISFVILFFLGLTKLLNAAPKEGQRISVSLTFREAAILAVALSIDGLAAGFGAGITDWNGTQILIFSFLSGIAAILSGDLLGSRAAKKNHQKLSYIGGMILIILAFGRLKLF